MNYFFENPKKIIYLLLILSLFGIVYWIFVSSSFALKIGLCAPYTQYFEPNECEAIIKTTAGPIAVWSSVLFLMLIILLFLRKEVFKPWFIFSAVTLPLFGILTSLSEPRCSGGLFFGCDDRIGTAWILTIPYLLFSTIVIIRKEVIVHYGKPKAKYVWLTFVGLLLLISFFGWYF